MSKQERVSWVSLIITSVVAWLYFSHVLSLPPDAALRFPAGYVTVLIGLSIGLAVVCEIVFRIMLATAGVPVDDSSVLDERDTVISLKATRNAHVVLSAAVFVVVVQIALIEWVRLRGNRGARVPDSLAEAIFTGPLTPMILWQLLLAAMTLTALTIYVSRIVYYRRGG